MWRDLVAMSSSTLSKFMTLSFIKGDLGSIGIMDNFHVHEDLQS